MKFQKLLISAATAFCLVGASGVAVAQDNTCPDGTVVNQTVDGNLVVTKQDCLVQGATITGSVEVNNLGKPAGIFILKDTTVQGEVRVTGGDSAVIDNSVIAGLVLRVVDTNATLVTNTLLPTGKMVFRDNAAALIIKNVAAFGDILCVDNVDPKLGPREYAIGNLTPFGKITCFGQGQRP